MSGIEPDEPCFATPRRRPFEPYHMIAAVLPG
jgi:hypothetical protein